MGVRTTLSIDDDLLLAAKEQARRERRTVGEVLSDMARRGIEADSGSAEGEALYGFRPFPRRGDVVSNELIDQIREDEAI